MDLENDRKSLFTPLINATTGVNLMTSVNAFGDLPKKEIDDHVLNTFTGVVMPTCEFMWSVLIFIRFGRIVSEAGVIVALALVIGCALLVGISSSSIAAISTNGIPRGGVFQILERSFGIGIGGSIALVAVRSLELAIFSPEEVGGLREAVDAPNLTGFQYLDQVLLFQASFLFIVLLCFCGSRVTHYAAMTFMGLLQLSLLSMISGMFVVISQGDGHLKENLHPDESFDIRESLSLLLPCYIGIFSGVNNARQLRNPFLSIPRGAFIAIGITTALYTLLMLQFGAAFPRHILAVKTIIGPLSGWPWKWIPIVGVYVVGLGAAMQCLMISSNVLSSLAIMVPRSVARVKITPRKSLVITSVLAAVMLFITNLEDLSKFATMSFLLCYGSSNLACFLFDLFKSPGWRPRYQYYHWSLSMLGFIVCIAAMFTIRWYFALAAILLAFGIAYVVQVSSETVSWGHGLHGLIFHIMLKYLMQAEHQDFVRRISTDLSSPSRLMIGPLTGHSTLMPTFADRIWRPQILVFIPMSRHNQVACPELLAFAAQVKSLSALCIVASVVSREQEKEEISRLLELKRVMSNAVVRIDDRYRILHEMVMARTMAVRSTMEEEGLEGFVKVFSAETVREGQRVLLQTIGLGELTPNTVMTAWPEYSSSNKNLMAQRELQQLWHRCQLQGLTFLVCKGIHNFPRSLQVAAGTIDVWWIVQQGQMLLMIAYLLKQHHVWRESSIRLFALCHFTDNLIAIENEIGLFITILRIPVDLITIVPIHLGVQEEVSQLDGSIHTLRDQQVAAQLSRELEREHNTHFQVDTTSAEASQSVEPARWFCFGEEEKVPIEFGSTLLELEYNGWIPWADTRNNASLLTGTDERSILFVNTETITQITEAIERHSLSAALVLFNLPPPDHQAQNLSYGIGIHMELVERLTRNLPRAVLVYSSQTQALGT